MLVGDKVSLVHKVPKATMVGMVFKVHEVPKVNQEILYSLKMN